MNIFSKNFGMLTDAVSQQSKGCITNASKEVLNYQGILKTDDEVKNNLAALLHHVDNQGLVFEGGNFYQQL